MPNFKYKNEVGNIYERLTVLERVPSPTKDKCAFFKCKCICGNIKTVNGSELRRGHVKSCGCLHNEIVRDRLGDKNTNWNHNLTEEERKRNKFKRTTYDQRYKLWLNKVFKRDNYTCKICNKTSNLIGHHLYSWHSNPEKRYLLKNGITLCSDCHLNFHKLYGFKNNTQKQFREYVKYVANRNG